MDNLNLIELMYGIAESGSFAARDLEPGEVVSNQGYGDEKRDIDQVAEQSVVGYFLSNEPMEEFDAAMKPEDAEWGQDRWLTGNVDRISGEQLNEVDYGLIVDQVEGTKNFDNRERYTSIAAIDPENPTLEGVEASLVYRWDDTVFFSDGNRSFVNKKPEYGEHEMNVNTATALEPVEMDEVDYKTKIRGQLIGRNAQDYAEIMDKIIDHYELEENDWPSLKADGTTTGDILGTVTDNSIAIDIRAQKDRERLPFAQDFAPVARIARDAGVEIMNQNGQPVETNFSEPGEGTTYIALPPGQAQQELKQLLPNIIK